MTVAGDSCSSGDSRVPGSSRPSARTGHLEHEKTRKRLATRPTCRGFLLAVSGAWSPLAPSIPAASPPHGVLTLRGDASRQRVATVFLGGLPVQASSIFFGECSDGELIAAEAQTARSAVLPFHENLKLVGVPDHTQAANAGSELLDLISPVWDRVVPQLQLTLPRYAEGSWQTPYRPPPIPAPAASSLFERSCLMTLD